MSKVKQVTYILLAFAAIIFLPLIGAYIHHKGHFPEGFFAYPMLTYDPKPGFSWLVFGMVAAGGLGVICLYLFPQWFGFQKTAAPPALKVKR